VPERGCTAADVLVIVGNSGHFAVGYCLDEIVSGIEDFYDTEVK
jgi:hypothetical protein